MVKCKYLFIIIAVTLASCGDLSEQKANHERLREGLDRQEIKRVTPDQILAAAYEQGNKLMKPIRSLPTQPADYWQEEGRTLIDSIAKANPETEINFLTFNQLHDQNIADLQRQILDAYLFSYEQGDALTDNVQTLDEASVWYTAPYLHGDSLQGIWSITQKKSTLILGL